MNSHQFNFRSAITGSAGRVGDYYDSTSGYHFVVATPSDQPQLWTAYLDGARTSYRQHDVEIALEYDRVLDGASTTVFFAALAADGTVVGGMRMQGPYRRADEAHALGEWAGRPGTRELRRELGRRLPAGLIEMKTGWVADGVPRRADLTTALARIFVHSMDLTQVRFAMCTVGSHAVPRWETTGGIVNPAISAVSYPDDRYSTVVMFWDRERVAELATPDQSYGIARESRQLFISRPPQGLAVASVA